MLNIITFDGTNLDEAIEYWGGRYIDLVDAQSIENRFLNLFNTMLWKEDEGLYDGERPTFDTDFDITIMKEIDGAERLDLQIVKTHIGTAPLTCLCTGTKFGILVNYYTKKGCKIVAGWGSAGENVFELMGRELDVTISLLYKPVQKSIDILGVNETIEKIDEIIAGPEIITTEECSRKSEERWNI